MGRRPIPERQARVCVCGSHGFVALTQGHVAFVSADRVPEIAPYWWHLSVGRGGKAYAKTSVDGVSTYMHRYLAKAPREMDVDHRNGDGLANFDGNLRICTHAQNLANIRRTFGRSPYKGVHAVGPRWRAQIYLSGRLKILGSFRTEEAAARAYDLAAVAFHGEFACTNAALGLLPPESA